MVAEAVDVWPARKPCRNTPISEFKFYGHFDFSSVRRGSKLSAIIYISNNLFDNALTHTTLSLPPRCVHVYILIKVPFLPFLGSYNNILFLRENKDWVHPTKFGIFGTLYLKMWWIIQWDGKIIVLPTPSVFGRALQNYIIHYKRDHYVRVI